MVTSRRSGRMVPAIELLNAAASASLRLKRLSIAVTGRLAPKRSPATKHLQRSASAGYALEGGERSAGLDSAPRRGLPLAAAAAAAAEAAAEAASFARTCAAAAVACCACRPRGDFAAVSLVATFAFAPRLPGSGLTPRLRPSTPAGNFD